jgi:hypothetical protein
MSQAEAMPLDSNTRDVALDILDRALHPGTNDEEVVASIYAWRRKTGNALIREVLQPTHPTEAPEPVAAEIVWQSIQRRDAELNALRMRLAASTVEAESLRRKVQVEIDRTIRTQQELEAARAKIANLEAAASDSRRWWTRS